MESGSWHKWIIANHKKKKKRNSKSYFVDLIKYSTTLNLIASVLGWMQLNKDARIEKWLGGWRSDWRDKSTWLKYC